MNPGDAWQNEDGSGGFIVPDGWTITDRLQAMPGYVSLTNSAGDGGCIVPEGISPIFMAQMQMQLDGPKQKKILRGGPLNGKEVEITPGVGTLFVPDFTRDGLLAVGYHRAPYDGEYYFCNDQNCQKCHTAEPEPDCVVEERI